MSVEVSLAGFPQLPAVLSFIESTRISHVEWHVDIAPFSTTESPPGRGHRSGSHLLSENGRTALVFDAALVLVLHAGHLRGTFDLRHGGCTAEHYESPVHVCCCVGRSDAPSVTSPLCLAHTGPAMEGSSFVRALALLAMVLNPAATLNAVNEGYVRPGIIVSITI